MAKDLETLTILQCSFLYDGSSERRQFVPEDGDDQINFFGNVQE